MLILSFENVYSCLLSECFSHIKSSEVLKLHQSNCSQDLKRRKKNKMGMRQEGKKKGHIVYMSMPKQAKSSFSKLTVKFERTCQTISGLSHINSGDLQRKSFRNKKSKTAFIYKSFIRLLSNYFEGILILSGKVFLLVHRSFINYNSFFKYFFLGFSLFSKSALTKLGRNLAKLNLTLAVL